MEQQSGDNHNRPGPLDGYNLLTVIGKGSYAKVILVKKKQDQKVYAMKIMKKKHIEKRKQEEHIMTERHVLVEVEHPFIIKMYNSFQNDKKLFFVLEYCPGGELFGLIQKKSRLTEENTKFYAAQIFLALEYLHQQNTIYRDLKPENVLIDADGYIRITDFGLSKRCVENNDAMSICGTPEYLAPEVVQKLGHGKPADWWCFGSIIFEMVTGMVPFNTKNRNQLFQKIKHQKPIIPPYVSSKLKNLLEGLFQKKPEERLGYTGAAQIRSHPWFEKMNWDALIRKQIKPPFLPKLKSQVDVSYMPPEFTECDVESYTQTLGSQEEPRIYSGFSFDKDHVISGEDMSTDQIQQFQMKEEQSH